MRTGDFFQNQSPSRRTLPPLRRLSWGVILRALRSFPRSARHRPREHLPSREPAPSVHPREAGPPPFGSYPEAAAPGRRRAPRLLPGLPRPRVRSDFLESLESRTPPSPPRGLGSTSSRRPFVLGSDLFPRITHVLHGVQGGDSSPGCFQPNSARIRQSRRGLWQLGPRERYFLNNETRKREFLPDPRAAERQQA